MLNYNVMPDYKTRNEIINKICVKYKFVKHYCAGKSVCGRPVDVLHIGRTTDKVLYCAGFHGSEYLTVLTVLKFFEECAEAMRSGGIVGRYKMSDFLKAKGLTVVPCVNPDGVEIALHGSDAALAYKPLVDKVSDNTDKWKANARGVDVNHNFNAGWKELKRREISLNITSPSPTRFGGTHPESEPETRALANLCRRVHFERAFAFHSQGREIYCSFGKNTPESGFRLAAVLSQASGYRITTPEDIATGGGFKDWFIEYFKKPAFTIEIGSGENPLPLSDFEKEYKIIQNMLCLGIVVQM